MRVLQVGSALFDWGGIERYVAYLTEGLTSRGHDVVVTCPIGSPLDKHIPTNKVPISTRRQVQLSAFGQYLKLFRQQRFDVVHVHFNPDFIASAAAAKITRQGPVILTRHVALPWSWLKVRRYGKLFDHIIPVSGAVERKLLDSAIPAEKMTVAKAGCPPLSPTHGREEARRALGYQDGEFVVGCFGRLVPEKGVLHLIEAAKRLPPGVRIEIFGDGPQKDALEERAKTLQVDHRVAFRGFISDVADAMLAVDCVSIPSTWDEAFPYAALEAMSVGRPIVASRSGGLPEIVEEGKTGLLVERGDAASLANAVRRLAESPEEAEAMGVRARSIHRSTYTVPKMAERIEAVYKSAIAARAAQTPSG
jgi:glycosyltransferase involved in cell wall biosynthesis